MTNDFLKYFISGNVIHLESPFVEWIIRNSRNQELFLNIFHEKQFYDSGNPENA